MQYFGNTGRFEMSAKLGANIGGQGGEALSGGTGEVLLSENEIADLHGVDAKEAVMSLDGNFAVDNPPSNVVPLFPGPIAEAFYWDNADLIGIQGPVGSGKTTTVMKSRRRRASEMPRSGVDLYRYDQAEGWVSIELSERADWEAKGYTVAGIRDYKVLFIRETYRQLWSTTIPSYLEEFPRALGSWSGGRGDPVEHVIMFEDEYGPIKFTAQFMAFGDDIIASLRGFQVTDIVLNEADTMPAEILTVGITRIDRHPGNKHFKHLPRPMQGYGQIVCDFNAPDEENWTFTVYHDEDERKRMGQALSAQLEEGAKPIRVEFYNQPGFGQPGCENLHNLSPSYYQRQIASMKLAGRGDMIDRLVYNKVVYLRVGEPVWQREFSSNVHVAHNGLAYDPELPIRVGLDQGFKGAAVIAQVAGFWRWRILAELHFSQERLKAAVFGNRLQELIDERFPGAAIEGGWGDMAGEQGSSLAADENATWNRLVGKAAGFMVKPQRIGTNRIQPRLEAVRAALEAPIDAGEPGLLIDPSCKYLIRGFQARYVWKDEIDNNGDKRKVPDKSITEANVHDALQYLLLSGHKANGDSPYMSRKNIPTNSHGRMGHNGGPLMNGGGGGLKTGWDVLNPYEEAS